MTTAPHALRALSRFFAPLGLLAVLLVWAWPLGRVTEAAPGATLADEHLALLYSSRLTFAPDGVPEVTIGLMSGKDVARVDCSAGCRVTRYGDTPQTVLLTHAEPLVVTLQRAQAGLVRYDVVVDELPRNRREELPARQADWRDRGLPVQVDRIGDIIALRGMILDTTRYLLIAASHENHEDAEAHLMHLRDTHGPGVHILSRIVRLPRGVFTVATEDGTRLIEGDNLLEFEGVNGNPLTVPRCEYGQGFSDHGVADLDFDGTLVLAVDRTGKLALANRLTLEEILKGTVPAETFASAPPEALKAQAIAARGQLIGELGIRHLADPYQLCATQHCQVYRGRSRRHPNTDAAVTATRGRFLVADSRLVETSYSACAGGYTTANETAWPQLPDPHRRARLDAPPDARFQHGITDDNLDAFLDQPPAMYCAQAGVNAQHVRWSREYSAEQLDALLAPRVAIGPLRELRVLKRGLSGRVIELELIGQTGRATVTRELPIRRLLGNLPSALIRLTHQHDAAGRLLRLRIDGAGFGHGVGMCQTGAIGRAKAGQSAEQILGFYYHDARLMALY